MGLQTVDNIDLKSKIIQQYMLGFYMNISMHMIKEFWSMWKLVNLQEEQTIIYGSRNKVKKKNMYPRQKMEECEKMLSVNSVTKC